MILVLQAFMLIFSFRFGGIPLLDSAIFLGILLMTKFFAVSTYRDRVIKIFLNKNIFRIFLFLSFIMTYSGVITILHSQNDFSILKPMLHQWICLLIAVLFFANCLQQKKEDKVICCFIYAFVMQAVIQCLSFLSPALCNFLDFFRSPALLRVREISRGIRGHALASMDFFGLGSAYGLIYIFFVLQWDKIAHKSLLAKLIMLLLLVVGGIMAARTSLIGLLIAIMLLLFRSFNKMRKKRLNFSRNRTAISSFIIIILTVISVALCIYSSRISQNLQAHISRFTYWAFELFINLSRGKGVSTASTNVLFQQMYFPINIQTILFGDGLYTSADGAYYMGTDAGYMRNLLFFGVFGFILLFIYQMLFFSWKRRSNLFINYILLFYILILHIKGDVVGFLIITQTLLIIYFMFTLYKQIDQDSQFYCKNLIY